MVGIDNRKLEMATIVPDSDEISSFPTPLNASELQLLETLKRAYDDDCIIYVQPHLNGLNPDFVLYSENSGVCVIEVKDWNLTNYQITLKNAERDDLKLKGLCWQVYDRNSGNYESIKCPFDQVQRYKDSIIDYEIPSIRARISVGKKQLYGLIKTVVAFVSTPRSQLDAKLSVVHDRKLDRFKYRYIGAEECSNPRAMREYLERNGFRKGSQFANWMKETRFSSRLRNALGYPEHGNYELKHLMIEFSDKQRYLLDNTLGVARRVQGVAGSGKTVLVVQKAVDAARAGHKVLVVCFNITMFTHLHELCTRLARHFDRNLNRNIEVGHYHRFFTLDDDPREDHGSGGRYMQEDYNVLLIDEGQDFRTKWIEKLQGLCKKPYHFFFAEDERQDIYLASRSRGRKVPGVMGRPNTLNASYRLPREIALLSNRFAEAMQLEQEQLPIDDGQLTLPGFADRFGNIKGPGCIVYAAGSKREMLGALREDLSVAWDSGSFDAMADNAVLVASIPDGWDVVEVAEQLKIPTKRTFESRKEYDDLSEDNGVTDPDLDELHLVPREKYEVNHAVRALRRAYKVAFRMRAGSLKLATIHSFKGWELKRIYVLFDPTAKQSDSRNHLLYTAMTRCQHELRIYDCTDAYKGFFSQAISENLVKCRSKMDLQPAF